MSRPLCRLFAASMVAVAAIVGGHAVVYTMGPTGHAHTHALHEAGHGHWPVPWLAVALLGVVGACSYGFVRGRRRGHCSWVWLWRRLSVAQVSGFVILEAGERIAAGLEVGQLFSEPVIVVGVAVQVAAAGLTSLLLRASERIAGWLAEPVRQMPFALHVRIAAPVEVVLPLRSRPDRVGLTRRGPPVCC